MHNSPIASLLFLRISLLALTITLVGCSDEPDAPTPADTPKAPRTNRVYVANHGWHTGLIVPFGALNRVVPGLQDRFDSGTWYEVGWGDQGFYQADQVTATLALRASLRSSGTVLHLVSLADDPRAYFGNSELLAVCLASGELASLLQFVAASFARDRSGAPQPLGPGIYGDSEFYRGAGRYHLFNTCNRWTATALQSAGLDIDPHFKLTAGSVMDYLHTQARACSGP